MFDQLDRGDFVLVHITDQCPHRFCSPGTYPGTVTELLHSGAFDQGRTPALIVQTQLNFIGGSVELTFNQNNGQAAQQGVHITLP
jgi:hypothetical protein